MADKKEDFFILDKLGNKMYFDKNKKKVNEINKEINEIIKETQEEIYNHDEKSNKIKIPSPKSLIKSMSKNVYAQQRAKETLALATQNIKLRMDYPHINLKKGNVLLIGPTGSGKTYLVDSLASTINFPVVKTKMIGLSTQGYVGGNIEDIFSSLEVKVSDNYEDDYEYDELNNLPTSNDIEFINNVAFKLNSKNSIVYLDEIDKISINDGNSTGFGESLQNELIGYVEDAMIYENLLPTKDMLFIGTGAFTGLEEIISKRINKKGVMGFSQTEDNIKESEELLSQVRPEDLIEYGLKPELIARFPNITSLKQLSKDDLVKIMSMKTSDLSNQKKILNAAFNIKINIPYESKLEIAKYTIIQKTNARGLQSAVTKILSPYYLDPTRYKNKTIQLSPKLVNKILYN